MNDAENEKLSEIARKVYSMTFVLCTYCENYEQSIPEISKLFEFSNILHKISEELFELL